jgi:hypothetical protein
VLAGVCAVDVGEISPVSRRANVVSLWRRYLDPENRWLLARWRLIHSDIAVTSYCEKIEWKSRLEKTNRLQVADSIRRIVV